VKQYKGRGSVSIVKESLRIDPIDYEYVVHEQSGDEHLLSGETSELRKHRTIKGQLIPVNPADDLRPFVESRNRATLKTEHGEELSIDVLEYDGSFIWDKARSLRHTWHTSESVRLRLELSSFAATVNLLPTVMPVSMTKATGYNLRLMVEFRDYDYLISLAKRHIAWIELHGKAAHPARPLTLFPC
jgi:hypothetical protein